MIKEYSFSPSELDYKAKKCPRCFYILKNYKITPGDRPPPVFSSFDAVQKPKAPDFSSECNFCNFTKKQIELKE